MSEDADPVLEAVDALRAYGAVIEPCGEELERWRVGDFVMGDADVMRLAERFGAIAEPVDA